MLTNNDLQSATASIIYQLRRNAGYLSRAEIERILEPLRSMPNRLEPYGYKVYSQNDEDGILFEIFRRLEIVNGSFCEIGVENGLECNTLYLIHNGWRGVWIEGNVQQKLPIENKFGSLLNAKQKRLVLGVGFITKDNINEALRETFQLLNVDINSLDFLSIDIDGNDIYLFEWLEYSPKVICIEYNAKFPPPLSKKPVYNQNNVWQGSDYMGSSLVALHEVAVQKGYVLVATNITGANAFFVRKDLVQGKFEPDSTPENLYNPPRYWLYLDHFMDGIGHKADFGRYTDLE
ncbi:hypothetical protein [Chlorobium sp. KB01]|uniref:hypothetical protein n=1 Tax=Chlorobium sp. KB01 TaxID=1917528 RepID=UPI0009761091|nr:hypothetical protein [Chlorobium sp. KB01]